MVRIHQITAAGGVGGSITMVVVFVVCLCCVLHLVWSSSLVVCNEVPENNLRGLILPYFKVNGGIL